MTREEAEIIHEGCEQQTGHLPSSFLPKKNDTLLPDSQKRMMIRRTVELEAPGLVPQSYAVVMKTERIKVDGDDTVRQTVLVNAETMKYHPVPMVKVYGHTHTLRMLSYHSLR